MEEPYLPDQLDIWDEMYFYQRTWSQVNKQELEDLVCARVSLTGADEGLCDLTVEELEKGVHVFTGEKLRTRRAAVFCTTLQAARLWKIGRIHAHRQELLNIIQRRIENECFARFCAKGECVFPTLSYWRYLATNKTPEVTIRLDTLIHSLVEYRDGRGQWNEFPFYFTLLALFEAATPTALEEIRYAAPVIEQRLKRLSLADGFYNRRKDLLARSLLKV